MMQSKSLETNTQHLKVKKHNKSYDFVNFYVPTAESNLKAGNKQTSDSNFNRVSDVNKSKENIKHEKTQNKKKQKIKNSIGISTTDANTSGFVSDLSLNDTKLTSTPKVVSKKFGEKVKSIMKTKPNPDDTLNTSTDSVTSAKRKKRNKSVSFVLDDTELVIKKSKSDASQPSQNKDVKIKKEKKNKLKKQFSAEKENVSTNKNVDLDVNMEATGKSEQKPIHANLESIASIEEKAIEKRKKKKPRKSVKIENTTTEADEQSTNENEEQSSKKMKKKKRHAKTNQDNTDVEEPANKNFKKTVKPDLIAESLENLNIGDNAHTLTDLIDKMVVVDKNKKKKKPKKKKAQTKTNDTPKDNDESTEEVKEKVKWVKKKWNKGRKDFIHEDRIVTSVIIENLPLSIMLTYKNVLAEHFSSCGQIRQIGIAELYPADNPKPVFNTTILFDSEDAATKALEEDNTLLEGVRIRVKRPLPHNQTTIVVRSYAQFTEQTLSTMFSSAGRIRKINLLVKGKKISSTAFIEFDSPEAVERAIKSAEGVQINRKKVHVFKYQDQYGTKNKKENQQINENENNDSE